MPNRTSTKPGLTHKVRVRNLALSALLFIPWACSSLGQAAQPDLTLDSVNVRQEGVVSFSTLFLGPESRSDFSASQFLVGQTDDQAYRLCIDLASIQQVRFNAFTFTAYMVSAKGTPQASKFQVTGNP
ncbi:MAG TPA: hypothetical protein VGG26_00715 [Terracidiphilus sp.]|jgi:hypothetical protein